MIQIVRDKNIAGCFNGDPMWVVEHAVCNAGARELIYKGAIAGKLLDAVVTLINHKDIS